MSLNKLLFQWAYHVLKDPIAQDLRKACGSISKRKKKCDS